MNFSMKALRVLAVAAVVLFASACTSGNVKKSSTSMPVEDRAVERWNHLINKQAGEAYEYLTPGYRSTHPRDPYVAGMLTRPVHWKSIKFMRKECENENTCTVYLLLVYELRISAGIPGPVEGVSGQQEKWLRIKGVWYHLPSE